MNKTNFFVFFIFICIASTSGHDSCFGGTWIQSKVTGFSPSISPQSILVQRADGGITAQCQTKCRFSARGSCRAFSIDYARSICVSYNRNFDQGRRQSLIPARGINFFERVCLTGGSLDYARLCNPERLWAFERVTEAFLIGFNNKTVRDVSNRAECYKICLTENKFTCRSAEFDIRNRECRLSNENRRSQPNSFVYRPGSGIDYLENQCVDTLFDNSYKTQVDVMVPTTDKLEIAFSPQDCQLLCTQVRDFTCRTYTYDRRFNRCYLSGDDTTSIGGLGYSLPFKAGVITGERQFSFNQCENNHGSVIFEKITGYILGSVRETDFHIVTAKKGITEQCSKLCKDEGVTCTGFTVDYKSNKCFKISQNSQRRNNQLLVAPRINYFEKICVKVNLNRACASKAWQFERVPAKRFLSNPTKIISGVRTRINCIEECLAESRFVCRSAVFNVITLDCELHEGDRRSLANLFVDTTANFEYLENQCPPTISTCPFDKVTANYHRYLDTTLTPVRSIEECLFQCNRYQPFNCRSFAYNRRTAQCLLSGDDRVSSSRSNAFSGSSALTFYESSCPKTIGAGVNFNANRRSDEGRFNTQFGIQFGNSQGFSLINEFQQPPFEYNVRGHCDWRIPQIYRFVLRECEFN